MIRRHPYRITACLLAAMALGIIGAAAPEADGLSPLAWSKYPGNPVIAEAPVGAWNHWKSDPFVLREDGAYKMWYGTNQAGSKTQIGYAESADGVTWSAYPGPVVLLGEPGQWDDEDVETPSVVKAGDIYHLWYSGRGEPEGTNPITHPDAAYRIGHATSTDGIHWVKDPANPVLSISLIPFAWDWLAAAEPAVVVTPEGSFEMWYTGATLRQRMFFLQIGRATSDDGTHWRKSGPVLSFPEKNGITTPTVIRTGPFYEMWFVAFDERRGLPSGPVYHALSRDGFTWRPTGEVLRKGAVPAWDWWGIFGPTVLREGRSYRMWYSGVSIDPRGVHLGIGLATGEF